MDARIDNPAWSQRHTLCPTRTPASFQPDVFGRTEMRTDPEPSRQISIIPEQNMLLTKAYVSGRCRSRNRDGVKPRNSRRSPKCVRNRDTSPDALAARRSRSLRYADIGSCGAPIHFAALDLLKACRDPWSARNGSSASWPEGDDNLRDGLRSSTERRYGRFGGKGLKWAHRAPSAASRGR